jgi:hypothetical protein
MNDSKPAKQYKKRNTTQFSSFPEAQKQQNKNNIQKKKTKKQNKNKHIQPDHSHNHFLLPSFCLLPSSYHARLSRVPANRVSD